MSTTTGPSFSARPNGTSVLPEYREASQQVVIHPHLMRYSAIHSVLHRLKTISPSHESFESTLRRAITLAFPSSSSSNNNNLWGRRGYGDYIEVGEIDYRGDIYQDILSVHRSYLSYERSGVQAALHVLIQHEDGRLRSLLGLLARGQHECSARRRMAFSTLMVATKTYLPTVDGDDSTISEDHDVHSSVSSNEDPLINSLVTQLTTNPITLEAKKRLYSSAINFIEERKDRAFRTVFLEPTMLFYRIKQDYTMEGDTDVHGSNYYLALIEATTGIRLPRVPLWDDTEVKGVVDYLHTILFDQYPMIKNDIFDLTTTPSNTGTTHQKKLGRSLGSYESSPLMTSSCPNLSMNYHHYLSYTESSTNHCSNGCVPHNSFIFNQNNYQKAYTKIYSAPTTWLTPQALAQRAISLTQSTKEQHEGYADYLMLFTHYFTSEEILLPLYNHLIQDTSTKIALQSIFEELKAWMNNNDQLSVLDREKIAMLGIPKISRGCMDVNMWVWGMGDDNEDDDDDSPFVPPTLNLSAVQTLLALCQITKYVHNAAYLEPETSVQHSNTNTATSSKTTDLILIPSNEINVSVAGDIHGGGTGREYKENLLKDGTEGWNKWLHPGWVRSSWIEYSFKHNKHYVIGSYGLCSANDCPHRDPIAWTLEGFDVNMNAWVTLHDVPVGYEEPFVSRFQWLWFTIEEEKRKKCSRVRLCIDAVRNPGDCLQLSHFHLKAVHASSLESAISVEQININIGSNSKAKDLMLALPSEIDISVAGDACGGGTGREYKENLLKDGTEGWNKWLHPGYVRSSWIQYSFKHNKHYVIGSYGLCSANDCPHRDPIAWTLEGYDVDMNAWVVLHDVPAGAQPFVSRFQWLWFTIDEWNRKCCSIVRLRINAVREPGDCLQLAHFHIKVEPK